MTSRSETARRRRELAGLKAEEEARAMSRAPTQNQLMLPLLDELRVQGGRARPGDLYDRLAERMKLDEELAASRKTFADGETRNLWQRQVRWARQTALLRGYIAAPERGIWELTAVGDRMLGRIRPGLVVTIFETASGVALWATAEAAAGVIEPESVDLVFCSPPYPLVTARAYGNPTVAEWLDMMRRHGHLWKSLLKPTGSMMINLGPVFTQGAPVESAYQERFALMMLDELGLHLAGKHFWFNPTRLPSPMPWVAIKRRRVKPAVETVWWFSRSLDPKADNRRVLTPYADVTLKREIGRTKRAVTRGSGYDFGAESWSKDNGGAIPPNLVIANNAISSDHYRRRCREEGLPVHPATFPEALPERGILLTTEPGDLVYDPMAGSSTTGAVAERLGRRWITSEPALAYVRGAAFRFERGRGYVSHLGGSAQAGDMS